MRGAIRVRRATRRMEARPSSHNEIVRRPFQPAFKVTPANVVILCVGAPGGSLSLMQGDSRSEF
jgi:hypothetical protein